MPIEPKFETYDPKTGVLNKYQGQDINSGLTSTSYQQPTPTIPTASPPTMTADSLTIPEQIKLPGAIPGELGYTAPQAPTATSGITFKDGISDVPDPATGVSPQQSIRNLQSKPQDQWNDTDRQNWNYATGNAPVPTAPQAPQAPATPETITAGADATVKNIDDYIKEFTPPQTKKGEETDLEQKLLELTGEAGGLKAEQADMLNDLNFNQLKGDLQAVNNQIKTRLAEYSKLSTDVEGTAMGIGNVLAQQGQISRAKASEIGLLQAQAQTLQGDINLAIETVNSAMDVKYSAIETSINLYKMQLDFVREDLSDEEKIFWEAKQKMINDLEQQQAERKQVETSVKTLAIQAMANGADKALADKIANASTEIEAMQIAGELALSEGWTYVKTPAERDTLIAQGYEITQSGGRTYARPGELAETSGATGGGGTPPPPDDEPLSINQIEQFRRSYGWTPPFGYTQQQLLEYMQANPDATPEELEAGAKEAGGENVEETPGLELTEEYFRTNFSEERLKELADKFGASKWYTGKTKDINRFLIEIMKKIEEARSQGVSDEETLAFINE